MNAVEIEEAVSELARAPFDPAEFAFAFLTAFGNKETTIRRLRKGYSNASDIPGGVLQRGNIHIAVCADRRGRRNALLCCARARRLRAAKAKFILATDGQTVEAEDLVSGEPLACPYAEFAEPFRLLPAARRHLHGQGDQEQPDRRQGDRAAQPTLCRAAEGQSRLGHRGAAARSSTSSWRG